MISNKTGTMNSSTAHIAVIGGGAAGLAAARILSREGWQNIMVFETQRECGGVWNYQAESTKKNPMYRTLRTNLPKELMAFREYPFSESAGAATEASFVTHRDVQAYLLDYRRHFHLDQFIQYSSPVKHLKIVQSKVSQLKPIIEGVDEAAWPAVQLEWLNAITGSTQSKAFDAVLVCNGHYSSPFIPKLPGIQNFVGSQVHSVEYDDPTVFAHQVVLCIGGRASGGDLAREISKYANHVYLSDTSCHEAWEDGKVTLVPETVAVAENGTIRFGNDCTVTPTVDVIIYCTGYDYKFEFIDDDSALDLQVVPGRRQVEPLYEQLWHPRYLSLAFVGLNHSVVPFPYFEFQIEAICAHWKAKYMMPPLSERILAAETEAVCGGPKKTGRVQDTHFLGSAQWEYCRKMIAISGRKGDEMLESYLKTNEAIYKHATILRKAGTPGGPDSYRSTRYERPEPAEWKLVDECKEHAQLMSKAKEAGTASYFILRQ